MQSVTVRVSFSLDVDLDTWHREHEPETNIYRLRQQVKERILEHVEQLDELTDVRLVNGQHR